MLNGVMVAVNLGTCIKCGREDNICFKLPQGKLPGPVKLPF